MNEESEERAVNIIKFLLQEEGGNNITIERQYLLEIFSHDLLELSSDDGLPKLLLSTKKYLSTKGITTQYKNKDVKFSKSLFFNIPGVKAAMIVSPEGLPIASMLPQGINEERIAAMTAILCTLSEKAIIEMKKGDFDHFYIKGSEGHFLVMQAGLNALLAVSTTNDVRLGLIFLDCRRTCEKIAN